MIDVKDRSTVTDYYVIVSGLATPHLKALFEEVEITLKKKDNILCHRKSGDHESGWMVMDYFDVVVHVMSPEAREYYAIEKMWDQRPEE